MEEYDYLFIDIEWNNPYQNCDIKERDAVSIGLIGTDKQLQIKKKLSRGIAPTRTPFQYKNSLESKIFVLFRVNWWYNNTIYMLINAT